MQQGGEDVLHCRMRALPATAVPTLPPRERCSQDAEKSEKIRINVVRFTERGEMRSVAVGESQTAREPTLRQTKVPL